MITKIQNSNLFKPTALFVAIAFLFLSFKSNSNTGVILKSGTIIALETLSTIQSDMVNIGQTIDFRVKYDVKVDDKVVIAAGSIAKGQVVRAQKARAVGKEGFLEIQIKSVKAVDGQDVFLSGANLFQEGEDKQTLSILLSIFLCIFFLALKGGNASVPPGYEINSTVATNTNINI